MTQTRRFDRHGLPLADAEVDETTFGLVQLKDLVGSALSLGEFKEGKARGSKTNDVAKITPRKGGGT